MSACCFGKGVLTAQITTEEARTLEQIKAENTGLAIAEGRVLDAEGQSIDFASVALTAVADSTILGFQLIDVDGLYRFTEVPAGVACRLRISRLGFMDKESDPFILTNGQTLTRDVVLQNQNTNLETVKVTAFRDPITFQGGKMIVAAELLPNINGSNAAELLGRAPGVDIQRTSLTLNGMGSVNVLINGRKRTMTVAQTLTLLRGIPAAEIKSIEIRSGKSINQDASGTGGEINIVTRKMPDQFFNATLNNRLSIDRELSSGHSAYLNLNGSRIRFNGGVSFSRNYTYGDDDRTETYSGTRSGTGSTATDYLDLNRVPSFNFNAEYDLNDRQRIGLTGNSYFQIQRNASQDISEFRLENTEVFSVGQEENARISDNLTNLMAYFDRDLDTLGSNLRVDLGWTAGYSRETATFLRRQPPDINSAEGTEILGELPLDGSQLTFRTDVNKKVTKNTEFSFGVKASDGAITNLAVYDTISNNPPRRDISRSDSLRYRESVLAAYAGASHTIGNFSIEGGLRYEYSLIEAVSLRQDGNTTNRHYGNLFPNGALSYRAGENYRFSLNYSASITRPNYQKINPYVRNIDAFTIRSGNSDLLPQLSNRLVLNAQLFQFLYLNLGHLRGRRHANDIRTLQEDGLTTLIRPENAYGIRANYAQATIYYRFGKKGRYSGRFSGLVLPLEYIAAEGYENLADFTAPTTKLTFTTGHRIKVTPNLTVEGEYRFVRGRRYFQGESFNLSYVDFGATYNLPGDKITISAYATDLFNTRIKRGEYFFPGYNAEYVQASNTRRVHLSISYRLGGLKKSYQRGPSDDIDRFRKD